MRSHDLNRLLDESGPGQNRLSLLKISFPAAPPAKGLGVTKADGGDDSRHHCNDALPFPHHAHGTAFLRQRVVPLLVAKRAYLGGKRLAVAH